MEIKKKKQREKENRFLQFFACLGEPQKL